MARKCLLFQAQSGVFSACHSSLIEGSGRFCKVLSVQRPGSGQCQQPLRPPWEWRLSPASASPSPSLAKTPEDGNNGGQGGLGWGKENLKIIHLINSDTHPWSQSFDLHFLPWIKFNWNYIFSTNFAETSNSATTLPSYFPPSPLSWDS